MVSSRLAVAGPGRPRRATAALILLLAGCRDGAGREAVRADGEPPGTFAGGIRALYTAPDLRAAGAWTWTGPDGATFVLVDVQSTIEGLVQARLDLWRVTDSAVSLLGRSDIMPSAAEIGAYAVGDLTGDGLPDLFGYVADPADVRYPVFLVGARGTLVDALSTAAPGWRFDVHDPHEPALQSGPRGPCALRIRAEDPAPDGVPAGWRWLRLEPGGVVGPPATAAPACP